MLNIVVVEDHDVLREELVTFLQRPGWRVRGVDCGEDLDIALATRDADIVLLDLNLPFEDGFSIARRLRASRPGIGIIMLTARIRPSDRTEGYEAGADVYLTKPTHIHELELVIQNLGRRLAPQVGRELLLDMGRLVLATQTGQEIGLTLNEAVLLMQLAAAPERQLSTEHLLRKLHPEQEAEAPRDKLTVLISRLRGKADLLAEQEIIKAVRGFGYRLTVPVTVV